jgi:hypothetical protein
MRKPIAALATLASASLVLAACAMPADDPNFIPGGSVDGTSEGGISANTAQSVVDQALVAPTSIGIDTPLAATPAAGALIVGLSDGTEESKSLDASMAAAAAALGFDGGEAYYDYAMQPRWQPTPVVCEAIARLLEDHALLRSCGTDTHGLELCGR